MLKKNSYDTAEIIHLKTLHITKKELLLALCPYTNFWRFHVTILKHCI